MRLSHRGFARSGYIREDPCDGTKLSVVKPEGGGWVAEIPAVSNELPETASVLFSLGPFCRDIAAGATFESPPGVLDTINDWEVEGLPLMIPLTELAVEETILRVELLNGTTSGVVKEAPALETENVGETALPFEDAPRYRDNEDAPVLEKVARGMELITDSLVMGAADDDAAVVPNTDGVMFEDTTGLVPKGSKLETPAPEEIMFEL